MEGRTQQLVDICNHSLGAATYSEVTPNEYDSACQQLINLLSHRKVEVNTRIAYGRNPLKFLCGRYYMKDNLIDLVKLLIQNGAEINAKSTQWYGGDGWTPLHDLCQFYKNDELIVDIVKIMIENGANIKMHGKMEH